MYIAPSWLVQRALRLELSGLYAPSFSLGNTLLILRAANIQYGFGLSGRSLYELGRGRRKMYELGRVRWTGHVYGPGNARAGYVWAELV